MLRQHGIRPEQVTVVNMAPEAQLQAMAARQIDAAMVCGPWMHRMIRSANGRIVETEGNLGIYTNVSCYSVRPQVARGQSRHGAALPEGAGLANGAVGKDHRVADRSTGGSASSWAT